MGNEFFTQKSTEYRTFCRKYYWTLNRRRLPKIDRHFPVYDNHFFLFKCQEPRNVFRAIKSNTDNMIDAIEFQVPKWYATTTHLRKAPAALIEAFNF